MESREKSENMQSKKKARTKREVQLRKRIITTSVTIVACLGILLTWIFRDFDAQGYIQALMLQNFQGEIVEISGFVDDKTDAGLEKQYEDSILSFVENNITAGIEMDQELKDKYIETCKDIFKDMKYNVKEAEKINSKEYHVEVEYQSVDVFQRFSTAVATESVRLQEKVDKGEYKGSLEEINQQMKDELLANAYGFLKTSHEQMQYAEQQSVTFIIKKNEEGLFTISDEEMSMTEFVKKIMGLDANQENQD